MGNAAAIGDQIAKELAPLAAHERVKEIRQIGTMTGIEVESVGDRTGFAICQAARQRGVWVRPLADVVVLMPPLAMTASDVTTLTSAVTESIEEVLA